MGGPNELSQSLSTGTLPKTAGTESPLANSLSICQDSLRSRISQVNRSWDWDNQSNDIRFAGVWKRSTKNRVNLKLKININATTLLDNGYFYIFFGHFKFKMTVLVLRRVCIPAVDISLQLHSDVDTTPKLLLGTLLWTCKRYLKKDEQLEQIYFLVSFIT